MRRTTFTVGAVLLAAVLTVAAGHGADPDRPRQARYHDRTITLDDDWDGARACAVLGDDDIRCFDTLEQMEAATGGPGRPGPRDRVHRGTDAPSESGPVYAAADGFVLAADCQNDASRWLYLWEHVDFNGRVLKFNDVDYWQNLTSYGFNDELSSFWNRTRCNAYLAEHTNGGGSWLWAPAETAYSSMPTGWNDRVSSLYILR